MAHETAPGPARDSRTPAISTRSRVVAALVHVFTASGIVCALLATLAAFDQAWTTAFTWLGIALVVDGLDGTFARMARVKQVLPRFSGEQLDNVIDYTTYVFIPVLMLLWSGMLSGVVGHIAAALILMSSLFHFSDTQSKTKDNYFVGFPAIWNLVAFYLFAFALPHWLTIVVVLGCVGLTFVPMRWIHPMRVRRFMTVNVAAMLVWAAAAGWTLAITGFPATLAAQIALGAVALYGVGLAFALPWAADDGHGS